MLDVDLTVSLKAISGRPFQKCANELKHLALRIATWETGNGASQRQSSDEGQPRPVDVSCWELPGNVARS